MPPRRLLRGTNFQCACKKDLFLSLLVSVFFSVTVEILGVESPCNKHEGDKEESLMIFLNGVTPIGFMVLFNCFSFTCIPKQQSISEEAIEAIQSFRDICSRQAQESLDNVLIDLYKNCGRIEDQFELLKQKLWMRKKHLGSWET